MAVVAYLNQKGGVGKSSTTHHLAGTLAAMGRRLLLVDADPQSSLTQGLLGPEALDDIDPAETIAAVLRGEDPFPDSVIRPSGISGVDLMPGSQSANDANVPRPWEQDCAAQCRLADVLTELAPRYDLVMIDCPPTLSGCSWAALVAADSLVVPLQAEDYGSQGVRAIQDWIATVRATMNPGLHLAGYLITMFNPRLAIHKAYESRLRATYGSLVFSTMVPYAADFKEAIAARQTLAQYKPKGASAKVVRALAEELMGRLTPAQPETEAA
ncbi:MAG: ATPase involved in chromosome partitioning [Planctomycetota bacterium]|nr:ATPase involved in chromosome partitioning [Planctomycetota bacterium]